MNVLAVTEQQSGSQPQTPSLHETTLPSDEIKRHCKAIRKNLELAVEHAIEAGKLLSAAKRRVAHGGWTDFVKSNCSISIRTAQSYMRLAEGHEKLAPEDAERFGKLPLRKALKAFSTLVQTTPKAEPEPAFEAQDLLFSIADRMHELSIEFGRNSERLSALRSPNRKALDNLRQAARHVIELLDEYEGCFKNGTPCKDLKCIKYEFPGDGEEAVMRSNGTIFLVERHQHGRFMISKLAIDGSTELSMDYVGSETSRDIDQAAEILEKLGAPKRATWHLRPEEQRLCKLLNPGERFERYESLSAWLDGMKYGAVYSGGDDQSVGQMPRHLRRLLHASESVPVPASYTKDIAATEGDRGQRRVLR